ncbi:MAG: tetratricopeptide repeat protein [Candidatus Korobacteraceae bacterium]
MNRRTHFAARIIPLLLLSIWPLLMAGQGQAASSAAMLVVLPFENRSGAPGLHWIGESFPEVLSDRMSRPWLYTVARDDRAYAFERAGVPARAPLSRPTLFRISEQMDVDYAVLGSFTFDGETFSARAQLLDVKRLRLLPEQIESGPLVKILEIQTALAWNLLRQLRPDFDVTKEAFLAEAPAIRLDAFENYIRGILAGTREQKIAFLSEAVRRNPTYYRAMRELGKTHFEADQYRQAADWLSRIPPSDAGAREANFFLGLAAYHIGQNERAGQAFRFVASQLPLPEIYNNLGVVAYRSGQSSALQNFQKAIEADPQDPDYRFNLALAMTRGGDHAGAARQLRECLRLHPGDDEAETLLNTLSTPATAGTAADRAQPGSMTSVAGSLPDAKLPPRIKSNYDESSFEQLALEIQNVMELRLAQTDSATHASYHAERGREMLQQGFYAQAERELREASDLDPKNLSVQSGLSRALEKSHPEEARRAAQAALVLGSSVEALLVLARLDLQDNKPESAAQHIDRALQIAPRDPVVLELQNLVRQKLDADRSVR